MFIVLILVLLGSFSIYIVYDHLVNFDHGSRRDSWRRVGSGFMGSARTPTLPDIVVNAPPEDTTEDESAHSNDGDHLAVPGSFDDEAMTDDRSEQLDIQGKPVSRSDGAGKAITRTAKNVCQTTNVTNGETFETDFTSTTIPIQPIERLPMPGAQSKTPISVNYHFTRKCNYACQFCFHTAKTSYLLPLDAAKRGLALLAHSGTREVNFAGGEPFLYKPFLASLLEFCKLDLKMESISIVSNASRIDENFLVKYGKYIDVLAVSCDSFDDATNLKRGRTEGRGRGVPMNIANLFKVAHWCHNYGIKMKLNTVVCTHNFAEDMTLPVT